MEPDIRIGDNSLPMNRGSWIGCWPGGAGSETADTIYSTQNHNAGFTLIELLIVVSIIGILAAIAAPNYQWSVIKAKESVLRENLYSIRSVIDQYNADFGKYPDSLGDLANGKYMRELPKDPFTGKNDTWITVAPPPVTSTPLPGSSSPIISGTAQASNITTSPGNVYDIHSGSNLVGANGTAYNEW